MRRPLFDLSAQVLPILSQLVERIFLTGLLIQRLGVGQFERWSLITATVTLLTMIDLGTQITFSNRMARAAQRGETDEAVAIFRQSNCIFLFLALLVMGATCVLAAAGPLQVWLGMNPPLTSTERIVALCLGGAVAVKLTMTNVSGVYRAMMAFGRGTLIVTLADLLRIGAGIGALLAFGSMPALAIAMAGATLAGFMVLIPLDLARQFPRYAWRLAWPSAGVTRGAFSESILFASSFLPSVVLTQIPIMLIGSRAAQGVLAGYVLMRTIANVLRSLSQKVTAIIGMELGRFETQGRAAELATSYRYLATLIALSFGVCCALLWSWGAVLLRLWTGSATLHDPLILAIMLAPLVLLPGTQLNLSILIYGHRPRAFALAVLLQTVGAALLALLLPIPSIALRMALAIGLSEVLLLGPVLILATRAMIGPAVIRAAWADAAVALAAAALTTGAVFLIQRIADGLAGLALSAILTGLCVAPLILLLARRLMQSLVVARDGAANTRLDPEE